MEHNWTYNRNTMEATEIKMTLKLYADGVDKLSGSYIQVHCMCTDNRDMIFTFSAVPRTSE